MAPKGSNEPDSPSQPAPTVPARRRRVGVFAVIGVVILSLVALRVWIGTTAFFNAQVLPRIGEMLEAKTSVANGLCTIQKGEVVLTARAGKLDGLSRIVLSNCSIFPAGQDPPLKIDELKFTFDLIGLLKSSPKVRTATLISPAIHLLKTNDQSNLDQMLPAIRATFGANGLKPELIPREIEIRDGSIRITRYTKSSNGVQQIGDVNLTMNFTNRDITPSQINGLLKNGLPQPFSSWLLH